ncbi:hypothetical protein K458DRAFT_449478 [Lentithecium fluviatile CBS 122367]|uniref:Phosphotransferase n=1 Tax=Lentithecium fluviatile CBS 122367 TaxID=1168545 RepID=A0A6G1J684_9PLEO|nr:hypothetical protein K458DRAFT_449478 [Lentithecium fluviatile CBS 122367]
MPSSAELVAKDSSWGQQPELNAIADLSPELEKELEGLDGEFWVSREKLKEIVGRFREELEEGLRENGKSIPMNLSWVHDMPSGKEKSAFLTLNLGGTNLRVCNVTLHEDEPDLETPDTKSSLDQEQYKLPDHIKTSTAEELWTYVAEKVQDFLQDRGLDTTYSKEDPMPVGFTFSYPVTRNIDHAVLQTWTKGFDIKGEEGQDAAAQLRQKLEERDLPLAMVCVINNTIGAMIASAYNDPSTIIGAIFGTGCNAAYMVPLSSITKIDQNDPRLQASGNKPKPNKMAINCEFGAFDNTHRVLTRTKYDKQIDEESPRPGEQAFERLSAGLYLGEIFRLVLVDLADRGLVLTNQDTDKLRTPYTIDTGFLSQIEDDESRHLTTTRTMFKESLNLSPNDQELELSRRLAEIIAVRGARLCACGIAAICRQGGNREGHVAADGSVANKHPKFKRSADDGSGVGCAIIAAMEMERRGRA